MIPRSGPDGRPLVVGIVGNAGAYGRWLSRFLQDQMGLQVIGRDPAGDTRLLPRELILQADVLVFSTPIRHAVSVIDQYVDLAAGDEKGRLWLDLTSIKQAPVEAMLRSCAEVVGLHPMTAPPKTDSLKGRVLAVCPARVGRWQDWLDHLLQSLQAHCVEVDPTAHDRAMALVQGMSHASHMTQARALATLAEDAGGLPLLHALRTVGYELDLTVTGRILSGDPSIYEEIQFGNPHVLPVLQQLADSTARLRDHVIDGSDAARRNMRSTFLTQPAEVFSAQALASHSHGFERLGYLLADLDGDRYLSVFLPEDRPGSLRSLLEIFDRLGVNLASIHSSRTPEGELHFRIGIDALPVPMPALCEAVETAGIGRVVESRDKPD
ncbi:prephenate dehydrogenase [Lysobacter sp. A03]|uniref:prephenate dehydrogenase n=1 Tax=Lysobacter sp. A03 TaxID=1199154 RepID=UPI0005B71325|nr:prephenate dehydrogenase [Lysobacter sp. A03]KIQ95927.1 Cyclohexadienyl dehydrogenase [Lysobacter sp. A03]